MGAEVIVAASITRSLRGHWHGRYGLALCPAHANFRTPALSLANGRDGRLLARCFAGCSFRDVMEALRGLRLPEQPGDLIVAADGDPPGREAAHALASRAHAMGWHVSLLPAAEGEDWNDVLRERVGR